ncbi:importin-9 isoform X2 [Agrilus planipennis]|uniref:Importin-9 isoform X2 n=1 Tax=Agrilus planipennis TaxID=224129 RepID=A0A1W4XFK4_AGRPL|nr:importin-9 isoform X2 [Agrilus planipennis]
MALKTALLEILSCMLSPDAELRRLAEERNKALEVTEEYGIYLLEIILSSDEATEERQMAAVLLRQYVHIHWCKDEKEFLLPVVSDYVKDKIRALLPSGLSVAVIQNTVAITLAYIAYFDFPQQWSGVVKVISSKLESSNLDECLGSLQFFNDFVSICSIEQLSLCYKSALEGLYHICQNEEKFSTVERSEAISVFCKIVSVLSTDSNIRPELPNIVDKFYNLFSAQLISAYSPKSDFRLKSQIVKTFTLLLYQITEITQNTIVRLLPSIWEIFSRCGEAYVQILSLTLDVPRDVGENTNGKPLFFKLINGIFNLIQTLVTTMKGVCISNSLYDFLHYLFIFMAVTPETEEKWKTEEEFVADDIEEGRLDHDVRYDARCLLTLLTYDMEKNYMANALATAVDRHMVLAGDMNESYYWRIMESLMYGLGSISNYVIKLTKLEHTSFDINNYLTKWAEILQRCPSWVLQGRIMLVVAQFSPIITSDIWETYIPHIINNLYSDNHILKVSAIRSVAIQTENVRDSVVTRHLLELRQAIITGLNRAIPLVSQPIQELGLRGIINIIKRDPLFVTQMRSDLVNLSVGCFWKNLSYHYILNNCETIVKYLCLNEETVNETQETILPIIFDCLSTHHPVNHSVTIHNAQSCALELLGIIVINSPLPLSEVLLHQGFMATYKCILYVNDTTVMQSGTNCLRNFLLKASSQIYNFVDGEGRTGADYTIDILKHILDPQKMVLACKQIGRLCITAMHTLGTLLNSHIDYLLRSVLSKMQRTTLMEEHLIVIFAYLFYYNMQDTMEFLNQIPGPQGESALVFVLNKWLSKPYVYYGKFELRLNIMALAKILEHSLVSNDKRLSNITVQGENLSNSIIIMETPNSRSGISRVRQIPLLMHIFKTLVQLLCLELHLLESNQIFHVSGQLDLTIVI